MPVGASQGQYAASEQELPPSGVPRESSACAQSTLTSILSGQVPGTASKPLGAEVSMSSYTGAQQPALGGSAQSHENASKALDLHGATAENRSTPTAELRSALGPDSCPGSSEALPADCAAAEASRQPQAEDAAPGPVGEGDTQRPRHYWGQALQYLEKSTDVTKGMPPVCLRRTDTDKVLP